MKTVWQVWEKTSKISFVTGTGTDFLSKFEVKCRLDIFKLPNLQIEGYPLACMQTERKRHIYIYTHRLIIHTEISVNIFST